MLRLQSQKVQVLPMSNLFNSIFNDATASANPLQLMLALFVSLILGGALAWVYKYRTLYTREFVISLTLLPCLMTLVIFLVNGSLGTSIAVAGTFSLIRFRSATSGSRELIAIFMAMIIGLAAGTGYVLLAAMFTLFLLAIWLFLETRQSKTDNQRRRLLTITVMQQEDIDLRVKTVLKYFCTESDLISLTTSDGGQKLVMVYEIDLKAKIEDFQITNQLISRIENCDVAITKKAKKRKNL